MQYDRRRQPMQPLRMGFGWLPAGYAGPGLPGVPRADPDGVLLDAWNAP